MDDATMEMRWKWIGQIMAMVQRLHGDGIIRGNVEPEAMVNANRETVVVSFW